MGSRWTSKKGGKVRDQDKDHGRGQGQGNGQGKSSQKISYI